MAIIERKPRIHSPQEHPLQERPPEPRLTPMTPVTEEELQQGELQRPIGRRSVLKALGVGLGATYVGTHTGLGILKYIMDADARATERDAVRREGSVRFVDRSGIDHFPFTTTLVFPGFNVDEIDVSGQVLAPDISRFGQVATVDYGNSKFDPDEIADRTVTFCKENGIYVVNLMGLSMGGMVSLHVAAKLREAKIGIESATFVSSPAAQADVIGSERNDVTMTNIYNKMADLGWVSYGGYATRRFAEQQVNDMIQRRSPQKFHMIAESENELPNNIIMQQVGFIGSFEITPEMTRTLSRVPSAYVRAPGGLADNTIDVISAQHRIVAGLQPREHKVYEQEGITHANVWERPDVFGPLAITFREDFDLPLWPAA